MVPLRALLLKRSILLHKEGGSLINLQILNIAYYIVFGEMSGFHEFKKPILWEIHLRVNWINFPRRMWKPPEGLVMGIRFVERQYVIRKRNLISESDILGITPVGRLTWSLWPPVFSTEQCWFTFWDSMSMPVLGTESVQ